MKEKLVDWLACPNCSGELRLISFKTVVNEKNQTSDIEDGILICGCGCVYPITDGVPRLIEGALAASREFVEHWKDELSAAGALTEKSLSAPSKEFTGLIEPTMKRFEKEWSEHKIEEKTWGFDQKTRLDHTLRYLNWNPEQIKGKLVLDAGAGTGQLTCSIATLGCEVVGIDLSPAVARGWHSRERYAGDRKDYVHFVQGNLMQPPFRKEIFDGIISSGVLHHTPDTKSSFNAIAPLAKIGGMLAVWLYKAGTEDVYIPIIPFVKSSWNTVKGSSIRGVTTKIPPSILYAFIWAYSLIFHIFYSVNSILRRRKHNQLKKEQQVYLTALPLPLLGNIHPRK